MQIIRREYPDYYTVEIADDRGRIRQRRDGTMRFADSRYCRDPEAEALGSTSSHIDYSKSTVKAV